MLSYQVNGNLSLIITLNKGGSKALIRLLGRGRSCFAEMGVWSMGEKENCLAYSVHFVFLTIRLVPGIVVIVAIDMC